MILFDYFETSDGCLYCVPRDLEREARETDFERWIYWARLRSWMLVCLAWAFATADVALLVMLIGGMYV